MAGNSGTPSSGIPWYSWLCLFVFLAAGVAVVLATYARVFPPWVRWGITGGWLLLTLGLGIADFLLHVKSGPIDTKPIDRWTLSHGGAGLVFGAWYLPLFFVLLLTVLWEVFEFTVRGFGDQEIIANRIVDVGIALVLWLLVVLVAMATHGSGFPLIAPYRHSG